VGSIIPLKINFNMMKHYLISLLLFACIFVPGRAHELPRVFIFTDINIDSGDPDDRQSLVHLFWYANEVAIEGIVPDRWNARGLEACLMALEAYRRDFAEFSFQELGYPEPDTLKKRIARDTLDAFRLFLAAASKKDAPLYVLVWGNMELFKTFLLQRPELMKNIRLITIGTGLMLEKDFPYIPNDWPRTIPCKQLNWNGFGRNQIYDNPEFDELWWLEINWTYAGMFTGKKPARMLKKLSVYGNLGRHMKEVVKNESWAQYFRAGDTPSLLYVIDRGHDKNNPCQSSWAGKFVKPFPEKKPNYYTDDAGKVSWDYANPCNTWKNHEKVRNHAVKTLEKRRNNMYSALLGKLNQIYR